MFCEKYTEAGILFLYDELAAEAKQAFDGHLKTCPQCRNELALLKESKLFAQMLPLEDIAPVSYEKIASALTPDKNIFEKYFHPLWKSIRSRLAARPRLALVPAAAVAILLMFYFFNPEFRVFQSTAQLDSDAALDWEGGLEESLDGAEQMMAQIKPENPFTEKAAADSAFYLAADDFSNRHLDHIEAGIQSLSQELSQLNF